MYYSNIVQRDIRVVQIFGWVGVAVGSLSFVPSDFLNLGEAISTKWFNVIRQSGNPPNRQGEGSTH
jgi:hypothetical protein